MASICNNFVSSVSSCVSIEMSVCKKKSKKYISALQQQKQYISCKIFYLPVYIFAAWESDTQNHLSMLLLKMSRDFVVQSSAERSLHREAPL